jgi:hypothetical protein
MPTMAIRTISFEKVRVDLNVMRLAIKDAKLNAGMFLYLRKYALLTLKMQYEYDQDKHF